MLVIGAVIGAAIVAFFSSGSSPRFTVHSVGGGARAVRLDSDTGDSWYLRPVGSGDLAWDPIETVADPAR